jgi:hypothetical protein
VPGDLVVDATGRASRTPVFLEELGYARPAEERIEIDFSYTTRVYRLPDESVMDGVRSVNPLPSPVTRRSAFFSAMEDGKWVLSVGGVFGDRAPADPEGFLDYVRSLPVPDIHRVVVDAEPLQRLVDEAPEGVVARAGDDSRAVTETRGGDRDVRRAAAEELAERRDVLEADADLLGVDVDPDAAHRDELVVGSRHAAASAERQTVEDSGVTMLVVVRWRSLMPVHPSRSRGTSVRRRRVRRPGARRP